LEISEKVLKYKIKITPGNNPASPKAAAVIRQEWQRPSPLSLTATQEEKQRTRTQQAHPFAR